MRIVGVVVALFLVVCSAARADQLVRFKADALTIEVHARESANLIHNLDCLAQLAHCSDAFGLMWRTELGYDDEDRRRIDEWAALRRAVERRDSKRPEPPRVKTSLPLPPSQRDTPWNKVRWAGFVLSDDALADAWAPHASADQITDMRSVMKHFQPRFHRWWAANESTAVAFLPGLEAAMRKARAFELLAAAARLYGSDLGDGRVFLHLFVVPQIKSKGTNGEQIGAHLTVEILPGENPEERVPVIVHELTHHVFDSMRLEQKAALIDQLVATGADGVPAWNLFDEVQATVIGNILAGRNVSAENFQKRLGMKRGFYGEDTIDLGARGTYPMFEQALAAGGPMQPAFAASYVEALRTALGVMLQTPSLTLKRMVLNVDPEDVDRMADLRRALRASSFWTNDELGGEEFATQLSTYPAVSAVVLARADRVGRLANVAGLIGITPDAITKALGSSGGVVFVAKRTPQAYAFVIVARDPSAFGPLIAAIAACELKPGVCHRLP